MKPPPTAAAEAATPASGARRPPSRPSTSSWRTLATPPCSLSEALPHFLLRATKAGTAPAKAQEKATTPTRPSPRPSPRTPSRSAACSSSSSRDGRCSREGTGPPRRGSGGAAGRGRGEAEAEKRETRRTETPCPSTPLRRSRRTLPPLPWSSRCSARRWPATHGRGPRRGSWPPRPRGRLPRGAGATHARRRRHSA